MQTLSRLLLGVSIILCSALSIAEDSTPKNLYELKKSLDIPIDSRDIKNEQRMKVTNYKADFESIRFRLDRQPVTIKWSLVDNKLRLHINGVDLDEKTINDDKLLNEKLDKILSSSFSFNNFLSFIIPQAHARGRRDCPYNNDSRRPRRVQRQRRGLGAFFRSLFKNMNTPRNRTRVADCNSQGRRNCRCPYRNDNGNRRYVAQPPRFTADNDDGGQDFMNAPAPTTSDVPAPTAVTNTTGVDFLDAPIGAPRDVRQAKVIMVISQ